MEETQERRTQAFMSALYLIANRVRHTLQVCEHDAQRWQVSLDEVNALSGAIFEDRAQLADVDFDYLQDNLTELLTFVQHRINLATDRPDYSSPPIEHLAQPERTGRPGRPRIQINPEFLQLALESGGTTRLARSNIAASASTIRRRAVDYGIRDRGAPVGLRIIGDDGQVQRVYLGRQQRPKQLSTEDLDGHITEALTLFPHFGRAMLSGYLSALGFRIPRDDIIASFRRVNGPPARFGRRPIQRRTYKVPGPNSLWHHDGHHKLIRWKIITHAFVDGYSRAVMGIHAVNNNRADTVLALFHAAVAQWGRPSRVRGDYGVENQDVAQDQENVKGLGRGSYIFGRSVHNIRIERLWVDIMTGYISKWAALFNDLEQNDGLDVESDNHIWLLQYLYLGLINDDALRWAATWNQHPMRLPNAQSGGRSPMNQYVMGLAEHSLRGMGDENYEEEGDDYGVDWSELENGDLVQSILQREDANGEANTTMAAVPPRWSKVEVTSPSHCPISSMQLQELDEYVCSRVEVNSIRMDVRRTLWVYALQYFHQLLMQPND